MDDKKTRILIIEDNPGDVRLIKEMLKTGMGAEFELKSASTLAKGIDMIGRKRFDILLLDLGLPDSNGLDSFGDVSDAAEELPIIVLTGNTDEELGIEAVQVGAQDYLIKGQVDGLILVKSIRYAIERKRSELEIVLKNKWLKIQYEQLQIIYRQLHESEERFRHLIQNLPNMFYRQRYDSGAYDYVSPQVEKLTGYTPEEVMAMGRDGFLDKTVHPEDRKNFGPSPALLEKYKGKTPHPQSLVTGSREFRIINKRGETFYIEDTSTAWTDETGEIIGSSGICTDITERKLAELALKESESKFRTLFNSAGDAIYISDFLDAVIEVNDLACETLGYTREEFLDMTIADVDTSEHEDTLERIDEIKEKGFAFFESVHRAKDGKLIPVELKTRVIDFSGKPAVMGIARDITDRKRAEEMLRALSRQVISAQEEERKRLSSELHDGLGQQLTALGFNIESLKRLHPNAIDDIDHLSEAMLSIADETGRICRGLRPTVLDNLGLPSALETLVREFEDQFQGRVEVDIRQVNEDSLAIGVPIIIYRVLQESLHNILRHALAGKVDIRFQDQDGMLELDVKDDGIGFSIDEAERSGRLGILGMRERVSGCGGTIEVDSLPGNGTRIAMVIPLASE